MENLEFGWRYQFEMISHQHDPWFGITSGDP
jgi:hypothetical protein